VAEPFLSIYTPTYRRPRLLARCIASVDAQTARKQIEHTLVVDDKGVGIGGMYAAIAGHAGSLHGEYVYMLQDDDELAGPDVVAQVRLFVREQKEPPVVMVKKERGEQLLPAWEEEPALGHVDLGNYVVRRDVFVDHAEDFGHRYAGDFDFIHAVWRAGWEFAWCDVLFAVANGIGMGQPER
jgi:hypothetical protein